MFCYAVVCSSGYLHFANVIETDSLQPLGEEMRYVCILNNPLLAAFFQGDDQKIRPVARGMSLGLVSAWQRGIHPVWALLFITVVGP